VLNPVAPGLTPLLLTPATPVAVVTEAVLADVATALDLAVSVPETDATANATAAGAVSLLASNAQTAASDSLSPTTDLAGAPGFPAGSPLPAAPTALSGSAASGAAGPSPANADVADGFAVAPSTGTAVSTLFDDDLPSSPTFPSDTTPD